MSWWPATTALRTIAANSTYRLGPRCAVFIEVKTRTTREVKPAEAAVDRGETGSLAAVAGEDLRHQSPSCQWRFDVIAVYYDLQVSRQPEFELFQNAFSVG